MFCFPVTIGAEEQLDQMVLDQFRDMENIPEQELDLEIPLASTLDEDGNAIAVTKTLRDIKADIDAEDALINRLGVCGL